FSSCQTSLRSFSLWARHAAECRAERALGCGGIFPRDQQAGARVRKRRREMSGRRGSSVVHDTTYDPLVEEPLSGGAHNSLRVPRPDPPLLPSIIFPLGPPFFVSECRAELALGCGGFFHH